MGVWIRHWVAAAPLSSIFALAKDLRLANLALAQFPSKVLTNHREFTKRRCMALVCTIGAHPPSTWSWSSVNMRRILGQSAHGGPGGGGHPGADFGDIGDIFETIFGSAFGGGGRTRARRGADLRYDLQIDLEDAFSGKSTEIEIEVSENCETCHGSGATPGTRARTCNLCHGQGQVRAKQGFFVVERPCPNCHGSGEVISSPCRDCRGEGRVDKAQALEVEIPPGVDTGTRIRLSGKGEAGPRGAPTGDLYIFLHVKPHAIFEREGTTLATRVPISFTKAALGGSITIPNIDGEEVTLEIPAGIQSGKQLRQRGAGMPVLQGRGRGDLVIEIAVETPTRISKEQRALLEQFRELETGDECPESRGFFDKLKGALGG